MIGQDAILSPDAVSTPESSGSGSKRGAKRQRTSELDLRASSSQHGGGGGGVGGVYLGGEGPEQRGAGVDSNVAMSIDAPISSRTRKRL